MSKPATPMDRREFFARLMVMVAVGILLFALARLSDLVLLLFGAILFAVLLHAIADPLARRSGWPPALCLALTIVALLASLVAIGILFGAQVRGQMETLARHLPEAWAAFQVRLRETGLSPDAITWIRSRLVDAGGNGVLATLMPAITGATASLLLVAAGGIYLAAQPGLYWRGMLSLLPLRIRPTATAAGEAIELELRHWLVGQLVIMVIVGLMTGIGAALIGLPSAVALGIIAGILEFVPYLGPIMTAVPAMLLGLAIDSETALLTLAMLVAVQQVEGYVLTPVVQRQAVSLPPALTLFALVASGMLFGMLGLMLATPLTVVAFVAVRTLYLPAIDTATADPSVGEEQGNRAGAEQAARRAAGDRLDPAAMPIAAADQPGRAIAGD